MTGPTTVPERRSGLVRRVTFGVRTRILATVLLLAALGMVLAGSSIVIMQRNALDERVNTSLRGEVEEFTSIANPAEGTGQARFTSVSSLLEAAIQKQAPDRDEAFLALLGQEKWVPAFDQFADLTQEQAVIGAVNALDKNAPTRMREVTTTGGQRIRYAAIKVSVPGDPQVGSYVVAQGLDRNAKQISEIATRFALVSLFSLIVVGVVGWLVAGRLLAPLRQLRTTAERISHTDLTERLEVTGSDDVSEMAATFNRMLDRLQNAFRAQQEFLDDAGHELRTPITIIRGHLELMAAGDEADVEETRVLVMDELDRMARLVQDLILLAQSRRPDFVRREPVPVDVLMAEVLDKAVGLADRDWRLDAQSPVWIHADPQRITQGLLQLAQNAVKYTVPGQVIAFGSRDGAGVVHLSVRDTGPGVSPEDAERIFERFGRGGDARRVEGSGLGLSIVGAIAAAHEGSVSLTSAPGESGAIFTLTIPRAAVPASATTVPMTQEVP